MPFRRNSTAFVNLAIDGLPSAIRNQRRWWTLLVYSVVSVTGIATPAEASDESNAMALEFFESKVRPLLVDQCIQCHGAEKQSGGLRLDSRDAMLKGGDSGPAIVPSNTNESLIAQAIRHDGDLKMPPETPLKNDQKEILNHWIASGAVWPTDAIPLTSKGASAAKLTGLFSL